jgi:hypothetical protein
MKELLEKLKSLDPTTYNKTLELFEPYILSPYPEDLFLENGPYLLRDALLQACLQEAISGRGWFFYIQWDTHYGWMASINEQDEPCEGDSPAKSLLAAYIAACEAMT